MFLSIIIPVYNVEMYIRQCLESCVSQDISKIDYEIIVVNDGSPDNSLRIIREYESNYSNIVVVDKANGGLSSARNAGLSIAKGEYVWFVDSDDWIEKNILKKVIYYLEDKPEILTFNLSYVKGDIMTPQRSTHNFRMWSGLELYRKRYIYPYSAVQFYIYKRRFLTEKKLVFCEGIVHEDWLFTPMALSNTSYCKGVENILYYYRIRSGSITHTSFSLDKGENLLVVSEKLWNSLKSRDVKYEYIIYNSISRLIGQIYMYYCKIPQEDATQLRKRFLNKSYWSKSVLRGMAYKYYIFIVLFRLDLKLAFMYR